MQIAARAALVLTGTAIFVAAMAMPVAHATARDTAADLPRPQPAPRPEKLPGYAHAELLAALSSLGRFLPFPALPVQAERRKDRSISFAIDADTLNRDAIRNSESSRGALPNPNVEASRRCSACASGGNAERDDRMRHIREPAPVTIKFEGVVINFNIAGLGW
jgi:hypothetical protein